MNKSTITLIMLLTSISFSQVNTTYYDSTECQCDSIHQVYDDNGKLASEAPYVNGELKCIEKLYFIDGTECECDSIHQVYDDNGLLETPYVNGKKNGVEKGYNNGALSYEMPYKNGKKNGIYKEYDNGALELETPYVNGKKNGVEKYYYVNGVLMYEMPFVNDKKNGVEKWYYENSSLKLETSYKNDKINGVEKEYDKQGVEKEYNKQSDLRSTAKYKNGVLESEPQTTKGVPSEQSVVSACQWVNGYDRKDGTYVQGYYILSFVGNFSGAIVEVINLQGQVMMKRVLSSSSSLKLSNLDAGVYMVRVAGKSVNLNQKIMLK